MWATCRSPLIVVVSPALFCVSASGRTFGRDGEKRSQIVGPVCSCLRCATQDESARHRHRRSIPAKQARTRRETTRKRRTASRPTATPHAYWYVSRKNILPEVLFLVTLERDLFFYGFFRLDYSHLQNENGNIFVRAEDFFLHLECARRGLSHRTTASARPETQSIASTCRAGRSF